ncbi:helicase SRCAP-like isoform X2 [Amphibalanus amphitrite]|uniref:helicase SRCAP-like isoform X2 n=1 Tax=Amphibalanus amphitrite TaxID=1232801 RepID=UPI001C91CDEC|nr:helicase SRCAP-like isoform X2 [Amphibalanus amphitrite]
MDHDESDPSELESFLQSCLEKASNLLGMDEQLPSSGLAPAPAPAPAPLTSLAPTPSQQQPPPQVVRVPVGRPAGGHSGPAPAPAAARGPRVVQNGLQHGLLPKSAPAPAASKPLNGALAPAAQLLAPSQAVAASPFQAAVRPPAGSQPSPVPAASPYSAARSPGQSPAPASSSPALALGTARGAGSMTTLSQGVVPAMPHGVILSSQSGSMQSVVGPSLIAAGGTLMPSNGLQMVAGAQNGTVMQLVPGGGVSAAPAPLSAAPVRAAKAAKQPQLLPKTLAPSLPLAKQTLMAQPPMVLAASGGLGGGGGGAMVVVPVMVQQPGGGHHIQYILREQPNLLFPAVSAAAAGKPGGAPAAPQQAVLLPAGGGGQTVLLQPSQQLLQPAIRLLAPQIQQVQAAGGPALFALAPQQQAAMLPQHMMPQQLLAQPQQPELRAQHPAPVSAAAAAAARRTPTNKKKRRDEPPPGQPAKKAFVDLEDIMKKSGIFGDMDDEPGLHTEPAAPDPAPAAPVKAEPPPPAPAPAEPPLSIVQPLQVFLNGAAFVSSAHLTPVTAFSAAQPVLSYAAGPGRPVLSTAGSVVLPPRAAAPLVVSTAPAAGSVLGSLLSQPSRLARPAGAQTLAVAAAPLPAAVSAPSAAGLQPLSAAVGFSVPQPLAAAAAQPAPRPTAPTPPAASTGGNASFQNAFLENLIKNQLCSRSNSKKKRKEQVVRVTAARTPATVTVAASAADSSRLSSAAAARLADNSVTSTTQLEPAPAPSPLTPTSFTAPPAAAEPGPGAPRPLVPSALRAIAPAPAGAVPVSGGALTVPHAQKVQTIQLSPENQQELNRVNLRMQLLLRHPERSARDADELKRLEAARQKIIATGQSVSLPVRWSLPTSTAAPAPAPAAVTAAVVFSTPSTLSSQPAVPQPPLVAASSASQQHPQTPSQSQSQPPPQSQRQPSGQQQQSAPHQEQSQTPQAQSHSQQSHQSHQSSSAAGPSSQSAAPVQEAPAVYPSDERFAAQLRCDQRAALCPDTETPFLNVADAVKRLSKYHVLQDAPAEPEQVLIEDEVFRMRAEYIRHKRHVMNNKYRRLLLKESMLLHPTCESIQLLRYLNQYDREQLQQDRQAAEEQRRRHDSGGPQPVKQEHASQPGAESSAAAAPEYPFHPANSRSGAHGEGPAAQSDTQPAVKVEPKHEPKPDREPAAAAASAPGAAGPGRTDLTAPDERLLHPAAAAAAQADAEFERLFDEPLVNGHGGADGDPAPAARSRVEDDLQSAIKSILNLPRTDSEPVDELTPPLPPPSRFNINASFFNADGSTEDSEALDEAVRSILL